MVDAGERRSDQAKPPEKGNGVKGAEKKQRLSGSIIEQKFRGLRKLERQLQEHDARTKRARAKEAKAAEQKKDRAEVASGKEFCRQHANWKRPRSKAVVVSEAELLALGGVKKPVWYKDGYQSRIIFGGEGEARLTFIPDNGAWKVALERKPSLEEIRRELCKAGRGLWNNVDQKLDIAFSAVEALLSCWENFRGLPSDEHQRSQVYFAISATLQALERDRNSKGRKLQLAFALLTDHQWPRQIEKLLDHARDLAVEFQRPPYKLELRKNFDPQQRIQTSNFATLLRNAWLGWLPTKPRTR